MKSGRKTDKGDETAAKPDPESGKATADVNVSRSGRGKGKTRGSSTPRRGYLDGQMLIAMPVAWATSAFRAA